MNSISPFKDFNYYVIQNNYIQAVHKIGGLHALMDVSCSANIVINTNDTYPVANTESWKKDFYRGDNYPASWNYLVYNQNEDNKFWPMTGAFNFNDAFIKIDDFDIPTGTTIFIIYNNFYDKKNIKNEYSWELWDELEGKLLMKSSKRYIVWNFITEGSYTVKLNVTKNKNITSYIKKSWITVY